jgi:hypothetical protein
VFLTVLLHLVPVWLVSSDLFSALWYFQCLLSLGLILYAIKTGTKQQQEGIFLVQENGDWASLDTDETELWQVSSRSRISSFLLWIELIPQPSLGQVKSQWLWIFPDAVSQADFRRLSRIIGGRQFR